MLTQTSVRSFRRVRHAGMAAASAASAAAALLLASLAQPASAAQPPVAEKAPQLTVSYRNLDLSRPADASTLLRRIERAAHELCGDLDGPRPLAQLARQQQCYRDAVARAVDSLHIEVLTARYRAAFGAAGRAPAPQS